MSVDILGTSCDQCRSMVQYSFTSTETRRFVRVRTAQNGHLDSHTAPELWVLFCDVSVFNASCVSLLVSRSSVAVMESMWPSWAVRHNEPSGFRGRYWTVLRHWSQLVPNNYVNWHLRLLRITSSSSAGTARARYRVCISNEHHRGHFKLMHRSWLEVKLTLADGRDIEIYIIREMCHFTFRYFSY